ncbi:MAG: hypothetical protein ACOH2M_03325 [Cypionkella sp.]
MSETTSEATDKPTVELKDGQIYRWRWSDAARDADGGPYRSYHCKSQIAVVHGGTLIDTFWSTLSSEYALNPHKVDLTFFADQSWPKIFAGDERFYAPDDVADTRHSNNSSAPVYLKPGATRNAEAIRKLLLRRMDDADRQIKSALWSIEQIGRMGQLLTDGRLDEVH